MNGVMFHKKIFNFNRILIPIALRMYTMVLPKMIRYLIPRWRDESLPAYRATIKHWKAIDLPDTSDEVLPLGLVFHIHFLMFSTVRSIYIKDRQKIMAPRSVRI